LGGAKVEETLGTQQKGMGKKTPETQRKKEERKRERVKFHHGGGGSNNQTQGAFSKNNRLGGTKKGVKNEDWPIATGRETTNQNVISRRRHR